MPGYTTKQRIPYPLGNERPARQEFLDAFNAIDLTTLQNAQYAMAYEHTNTTAYKVWGRNASDELEVGDGAMSAATRYKKAVGGSHLFEVGSGTVVVTINGTGLGIGMTPSFPLDVSGAARVSGAVTLQSTLAVTGLTTATGGLTSGGTVTVGAHNLDLSGSTVVGQPTWNSAQSITLLTANQPNVTTVNGQTISAAASFTGSVTAATYFDGSVVRATGASTPATGSGAEMGVSGGVAFFQGFNRTGAVAIAVQLGLSSAATAVNGNAVNMSVSGSQVGWWTSTGLGVGQTPSYKLDVNGQARIGSNVGIFTAPSAWNGLYLTPSLSGSVDQYGIRCDATVSSGATTGGTGLRVSLTLPAASFTMTNAYGVYVAAPTLGTGSAITTAYGIYFEGIAGGGTNYAIYTAGTTPSRFGGDVNVEVAGNPTLRLNATANGLSRVIAHGAAFGDDGYLDYDNTNRCWIFGTAATERIRIDSSGNLIGNSATVASDTPGINWRTASANAVRFAAIFEQINTGTGAGIGIDLRLYDSASAVHDSATLTTVKAAAWTNGTNSTISSNFQINVMRQGSLAAYFTANAASDVVILRTADTDRVTIDSSGNLIQSTGYYSIGSGAGNVAQSGVIRLRESSSSANAGAIVARNQANSADRQLLQLQNDTVIVGDSTAKIVMTMGASSGTGNAVMGFWTGGSQTVTVFYNGCTRFGSATGGTGGDMGAGTINVATGVYLNGAAYTNPDYVFEHFYTGRVTKNIDEPGAARYGGLRPLDELRAYTAEHWHLPGFSREHDLFRRSAHILSALEECYLHLFGIDGRVRAIESAFGGSDRLMAVGAGLVRVGERLDEHERRLAALEAR